MALDCYVEQNEIPTHQNETTHIESKALMWRSTTVFGSCATLWAHTELDTDVYCCIRLVFTAGLQPSVTLLPVDIDYLHQLPSLASRHRGFL
jgi:hypothetical protein